MLVLVFLASAYVWPYKSVGCANQFYFIIIKLHLTSVTCLVVKILRVRIRDLLLVTLFSWFLDPYCYVEGYLYSFWLHAIVGGNKN